MKILLLAPLLWTLAVALPSPEANAVCSALHSKYPNLLVWDPAGPNGAETIGNAATYNDTLLDYWNAASSNNRAACGFFPANAEQVSFAVETLNAHPSVEFALKSGGHNPNLGFSSVDGGLLIAFRPNSQYAVPSPDGKTVEVGAGCKWVDVYKALQPLGRTAVGGRLNDVGVTGFMLGGGLSYLSAQYGLACDNVVSYEAVLANGEIVTASPTSNPDLYFALRGGGNQYAIVTKLTLKTHEIGDHGTVWGGMRAYTADKHEALEAAIADFTASGKDPKAAMIPTFEFIGAAGLKAPIIIVFFFYDGSKPANDVFARFDAIASQKDTTRPQSYVEVTTDFVGGPLKGNRVQIAENTFPNMPQANMSAFLSDHFKSVLAQATAGAKDDIPDFRLLSYALQPMPHGIAQASHDAGLDVGGGNALGLQPEHGDRLWVEYDIAWPSAQCDQKCPEFLKKMIDTLHDLHEQTYSGIAPTNYKSGDLSYLSYNPIFMNDAMNGQDPLRSYGDETYQRLKATHEAYDPHGFLATRQGGFKFT